MASSLALQVECKSYISLNWLTNANRQHLFILRRAVTCIDLTTLAGDDTEANVARLCLKAGNPIRKDIVKVQACLMDLSLAFHSIFLIDSAGHGNG